MSMEQESFFFVSQANAIKVISVTDQHLYLVFLHIHHICIYITSFNRRFQVNSKTCKYNILVYECITKSIES